MGAQFSAEINSPSLELGLGLGLGIELQDACVCGNMDQVHSILRQQPLLINTQNYNEHFKYYRGLDLRFAAPLHVSVWYRQKNIVAALLQMGADPNLLCFSSGFTPLHVAVQRCEPDLVKILLKAGAKPDLQDKNGQNPLDLHLDRFHLTQNPRYGAVRRLLVQRTPMKTTTDGERALMFLGKNVGTSPTQRARVALRSLMIFGATLNSKKLGFILMQPWAVTFINRTAGFSALHWVCADRRADLVLKYLRTDCCLDLEAPTNSEYAQDSVLTLALAPERWMPEIVPSFAELYGVEVAEWWQNEQQRTEAQQQRPRFQPRRIFPNFEELPPPLDDEFIDDEFIQTLERRQREESYFHNNILNNHLVQQFHNDKIAQLVSRAHSIWSRQTHFLWPASFCRLAAFALWVTKPSLPKDTLLHALSFLPRNAGCNF